MCKLTRYKHMVTNHPRELADYSNFWNRLFPELRWGVLELLMMRMQVRKGQTMESKMIDLRTRGLTNVVDGYSYIFGYGKTRVIRQFEYEKISKILASVEDMDVGRIDIRTDVKRPYTMITVNNGPASFSINYQMIILYLFNRHRKMWKLVTFIPGVLLRNPNDVLTMDKTQAHVLVVDITTGKERHRYPISS